MFASFVILACKHSLSFRTSISLPTVKTTFSKKEHAPPAFENKPRRYHWEQFNLSRETQRAIQPETLALSNIMFSYLYIMELDKVCSVTVVYSLDSSMAIDHYEEKETVKTFALFSLCNALYLFVSLLFPFWSNYHSLLVVLQLQYQSVPTE